MRVALAQLNVVVGDLDGNRDRMLGHLRQAEDARADLVVFPELAVTGYPPEDLLLRPGFVKAAARTLDEIARACTSTVALVGVPLFDRDLANACAVCADGRVLAVYRKQFLPNYGVFDEHRYFTAGRDLVLLRFGDVLVGPTVCEDMWQPGPPATDLALAGAQLLVNLSASPFHVGKAEDREEMLVTRARDNAAYVAFCNLVGGQDELVLDGHSVVLDDEAVAIEDELVLAADQVAERDRHAVGTSPLGEHPLPVGALAAQIGRARRVEDQARPTFDLERGGRAGLPEVLADGEPERDPVDDRDRGLAAGLEVANLVKDPVVGEPVLAVDDADLASGQQRHRVVGGRCRGRVGSALAHFRGRLGEADQGGDPNRAGGELLERGRVRGEEVALQVQVLGRITREAELGKDDEVGAGFVRAVDPRPDQRRVAVEIADGRVYLGERNT